MISQPHCFKADSVFAAGTNADIVALWYPDVCRDERQTHGRRGFNAITAEQGAAQSVPLPGSRDAIASLHRFGLPARRRHQRFDQRRGKDAC